MSLSLFGMHPFTLLSVSPDLWFQSVPFAVEFTANKLLRICQRVCSFHEGATGLWVCRMLFLFLVTNLTEIRIQILNRILVNLTLHGHQKPGRLLFFPFQNTHDNEKSIFPNFLAQKRHMRKQFKISKNNHLRISFYPYIHLGTCMCQKGFFQQSRNRKLSLFW